MSLINCLRMIGSEEDVLDEVQDKKKANFKMCLRRMERSWSGDLAPNFKPKPNFRKMRSRSNLGPTNKSKKTPPPLHRIHNSGPSALFGSAPPTPRLVRSSGMRRDWSFEDLRLAFEG
ncbi:hypothetical protein Pfo_025812 [Paulownia fortunei]|nr:hypothetical protein Pfo_025812 [Paulownia fortunei]